MLMFHARTFKVLLVSIFLNFPFIIFLCHFHSFHPTVFISFLLGVRNLDSGTGVYAGDEESYTLFAPLFDKIIEDYHAPYKLADKHTSDMNPEKVDAPDLDPDGSFIRSTRIRVARNLKGYALTPALSKSARVEIEQKVMVMVIMMIVMIDDDSDVDDSDDDDHAGGVRDDGDVDDNGDEDDDHAGGVSDGGDVDDNGDEDDD